jgi:NAD(P)-dependent dehydrogenase (short-subunit alcohol dehydrogenase family)
MTEEASNRLNLPFTGIATFAKVPYHEDLSTLDADAPKVRVNAVCPGTVNTPMMDANYAREIELTGATKEEIESFLLAEIPMGRFQDPIHIAKAMRFLCSEESSEMTGQAINVTGGKVLW